MTALVVLGCVLCAAAGLSISYLLARGRSDALAREAHRLGLSFQASSVPFASSRVEGLSILPEGASTEVANMMSGSISGRPVLLFDLSFCCEGNPIVTTVAAFPNNNRALPAFQIAPQTTLTRLDQLMTRNVVRFESDSDFSRRFYVHSADEPRVLNVFNNVTRRHLLRYAGECRIECGPEWICVYKPGKRIRCDSVQQFMISAATMTEVLQRQHLVPARSS